MNLEERNGKLYATAEAYIVESVDQLPREIASELPKERLNPSFIWVAGRYVQGNAVNKNGHYWTLDDLQKGEKSIRHTPLNINHVIEQPVGTFVETKIVQREDRVGASDRLLPEIQALGVVWAANFPDAAAAVRAAHAQKSLFYSMECIAESKQCMTCENIYPWASAAHETCAHLATNKVSPRRFINPIFLGGALVIPPEMPAWKDANITEMSTTIQQWEEEMAVVLG